MRFISSAENGSVGSGFVFRRLDTRRGISIDPPRVLAEPKERAHPLEVLRRVHRAIVPRRSELAGRADVDLFQQPQALRLAPADEPLFEEVLVLPNRLPTEVPRVRVLDKLRDRLSHGWN